MDFGVTSKRALLRRRGISYIEVILAAVAVFFAIVSFVQSHSGNGPKEGREILLGVTVGTLNASPTGPNHGEGTESNATEPGDSNSSDAVTNQVRSGGWLPGETGRDWPDDPSIGTRRSSE